MNSFAYDFHIHSCLSPCGDSDMTPNNIVNMAILSGCDMIAITDHNSCKNAPAVMKVGEKLGVTVVPGMELCTSEETHVVCLFETLENAMLFDDYVYENMPHIKNRAEIFGEQRILNENDELVRVEENLLLVSSYISVNDVVELINKYGGVAFPAHVDRDSYSVIASLGIIPLESGFTAAEVTKSCDLEKWKIKNPELEKMLILRDSDSHYLESMVAEPNRISIPEKSAKGIISAIRTAISK